MDKQAKLRSLPKMDELLKRDDVGALLDTRPRVLVLESLRESVDDARSAILGGGEASTEPDDIVAEAVVRLGAKAARSLTRVVNATGIIVHTNLGRAPMSPAAVAAVEEVARGYSTLEYDLATAERGSRQSHVEDMLCRLTGAEAAMAVNNNASAVLIGLAALADGKEAIVSRGQLVEIGGSFRIPDIMAQSGAKMVEVGTTNKTRLSDYERAMGPDTGLLLKVHSSNFRVVGFTEEVAVADLVDLGAAHGIPVFEDQGSGVLIDLRAYGLPYEPTIRESVEAGADLVSASGDKLLGGPQAGLLAGRSDVIAKLKAHPLARALRCDKMTLAALEVTLRTYLDEARAVREVPVLRMLTMPLSESAERASALADAVRRECGDAYSVEVAEDVARAGGGALPMADIPSMVVSLVPRSGSVSGLEAALRLGEPAVIARIHEDRLLLDPRTLLPGEDLEVVSALADISRSGAEV